MVTAEATLSLGVVLWATTSTNKSINDLLDGTRNENQVKSYTCNTSGLRDIIQRYTTGIDTRLEIS